MLYRPNSELARVTESFVEDLQRRYPHYRVEVVSIYSRDGSATASLYDVMDYPAILVLSDAGVVQQSWVGRDLPRVEDVAGAAFAYA